MLTHFAPSPTGYLHLGHVVNAIHVWGCARTRGGQVLLRIEDHDRIRSRADHVAAILEDLAWHHPLLLKPPGERLSKSSAGSGVRELRRAGASAPDVIGRAAAGAGLISAPRPISAAEVGNLFLT